MCAQFLIYTKIPLVEFPLGSGFLCPPSWYSPKDTAEELGWSKSGLNAAGSPLYSSLEAKRREAKLPPLKWGFLITENNPLAGSKEQNLFPQPKRGRTQWRTRRWWCTAQRKQWVLFALGCCWDSADLAPSGFVLRSGSLAGHCLY